MNNVVPELLELAEEASRKAYAPYSRFPVGCVITTEKGGRYTGCNTENISFGLTMCAERSAIFKAVSEEGPDMKVVQVIIYTPTDNPIAPCGACRQVIYEFGKDAEIISRCNSENSLSGKISFFLPDSPDIRL
ncbi:MAG: cytidine deaminase [Cyclobacteriaceae bacterium]|nr:cytidine deaminase [Cyclobacteriaceae bacterium]